MRAPVIKISLAALALLAGFAIFALVPPETSPPRAGIAIGDARTWGYQLQNIDARFIPDAVDVLVVEYSRDGRHAMPRGAIDALRRRRDGSARIVLAYLSIGEAESYRDYWDPRWVGAPPDWLGAENEAWHGNYAVRYWDPAWQRLILGTPRSTMTVVGRLEGLLERRRPYLEQIVSAGFDGVFLDRVDAYEKVAARRASAKADMIAFVAAISAYAKARLPGFLVVPQNAEELLSDAGYRAVIDGVAKEDLFFGEAGDGVANPPPSTRRSIALLNRAKADGRPVFVVEYIQDAERQRVAADQLRTLGYLGLFAERGLKLPPQLPPAAAAAPPAAPQPTTTR